MATVHRIVAGLVSEELIPYDPISEYDRQGFVGHGLKISGRQQRWPRPLPGAILIPPALLVVADLGYLIFYRAHSLRPIGTRAYAPAGVRREKTKKLCDL